MGTLNDGKKKVTIYSVAHEAGVSLATVSRVINDSSLVKEETRKRVEAAIVKLGYRPNAVAQGLALKKTTTIALVIPDSSFLYMGKIINGLLDVAKIYKYNIALHTTSSSISEMSEIIDNIVKSRADGVIVYNDCLTENEIAILNSFSTPMVYIGHKIKAADACNVFVDYKKALYELTDKYIQEGYKDIVLIQDKKNPMMMDELLEGIDKGFSKHNMKFDGLVEIPENYHNSYDYLNEYFKDNKHQLVITVRDSQAMAVLNACTENGISIPEETDLVCVMDSRYTDMVRPRISSFFIPSYDLGALAMRVMTKMLDTDEIKEKEYQLSYIYKNKASTKI
ncbi:MAG: LacI family DNA-binding transcriptional regulator [Bacillota bacterium]|jgi:LacI family transcriptional regulator|nr:LacI family DNA-binding transcriptional regulator [Bacillota bacterium]NLL26621.1 LacI family DNA-binding transcriptional regulator [Erysipelotrichia bacterium]